MVELFSEAAWRVMKAGFDGIQLHAAHGYLISDFMSPYLNKRIDRFGGSFENRMRFPLSIIASIQKKCGTAFPISVRYNAIEFTPGGRDMEECLKTAVLFQDAGAASIDLSTSGAPSVGLDPMYMNEGWTLYISEAVKKAVTIPVMISHSLRNPDFCERALAEGKTDMIGLSRQILADPFWPLKAYYGKEKKIRRCISCLEGCWQESILAKKGISCSINPACGNDAFDDIGPVEKPLRIAVVGGGPAGMEAARISALRGHKVTLFEKTAELGGAILGCCLVEGKEKMKWYADWIREEIKDLGIDVRLNSAPGPEELKGCDAVVNATGARSVRPVVPGGDGPNVVRMEDVMVCPKVACEYHPKNGRAPVKTGDRVLIWGDHYPAADTAAHFARMGKAVTIVTASSAFGKDIEVIHLAVLRKLFERKKVEALEIRPFKYEVKTITGSEIIGIEKNSVILMDSALKTRKVETDTVVCCRMEPDTELAAVLREAGIPFVSVGDSVKPRNLHAAVKEGAEAGRTFEKKVIFNTNNAPVDRPALELRRMIP
jgi:thioredoxin reductase